MKGGSALTSDSWDLLNGSGRVLRSEQAMTDTLTPKERSERMSRIRGSNTKPELNLRRHLHTLGFRFRLHRRDLPGCPDIVLPRFLAAIFVQGCFRHRHDGCSIASLPKTNRQFWMAKFRKNVERDRRNQSKLRKAGWHVYVVWECQLNSNQKARKSAERLSRRLTSLMGATSRSEV